MKITIFTTNTCAYCAMVKRYLDGKQRAYEIVNLDSNPERQAEAYALSGALTVPITLIENGDEKTVVVGWNLSKLAPAVA